jgi:hypothetical protein
LSRPFRRHRHTAWVAGSPHPGRILAAVAGALGAAAALLAVLVAVPLATGATSTLITLEQHNLAKPGMTYQGVWRASTAYSSAANQPIATTVSYPRLASDVPAHYLRAGSGPTAECPGSSSAPRALPGHLCVYESGFANAMNQNINAMPGRGRAGRDGAQIGAGTAGGVGPAYTYGAWAVTAP